jgi:CheY-like chemotaxis protein
LISIPVSMFYRTSSAPFCNKVVKKLHGSRKNTYNKQASWFIFPYGAKLFLCGKLTNFMKRKKTLLIVEDSMIVVDRLIPMLESLENIAFVIHAGSYEEAIEMLAAIRPDFILLDIQLPDKSGIELLKEIREKDQEMIVIMISNHATPEYGNLCKRLGAQHFFDKSKDFELISDVIEEVY